MPKRKWPVWWLFGSFGCAFGAPTLSADVLRHSAESSDDAAFEEFNIEKNHNHRVLLKLGDASCEFDFRARNPDDSQWEIKLTRHGKDHTCVVKRKSTLQEAPHPAHLVGYSLTLSGSADGDIIDVSAWDFDGELLRDEDYVVEGSHVRSDTGWKNTLRSVSVTSQPTSDSSS